MRAYYNDNDPHAAGWLRELMAEGLIPGGVVDERSIADVAAADLRGFDAVHLFAGIGGWPLALTLGNWPAGRPVWTGSCPCQPFSTAGRRRGESDPRHLWPHMRRLVAECRPPVCFGEQVAGRRGLDWLAGVRADLEALGYAVGSSDMCAAGVRAPHQRQRLYWVAHAAPGRLADPGGGGGPGGDAGPLGDGPPGGVADPAGGGRDDPARPGGSAEERPADPDPGAPGEQPAGSRGRGRAGGVGEPEGEGREVPVAQELRGAGRGEEGGGSERPGGDGPWSEFETIACRDGWLRRAKPGVHPLAHGLPPGLERVWATCRPGETPPYRWAGRVALLRGYGNAVVPQLAGLFVRAYLTVTGR